MSYGKFINKGKSYVIQTPHTPDSWYNYLYNDTYYMEVSQTLLGTSQYLKPTATNYIDQGYRFFYILNHVNNESWSPNYRGQKKNLDSFMCTHSLGYTKLESAYNKIESSIRVFVPLEGQDEIWTVKIVNTSKEIKEISLFTSIPFKYSEVMESECYYQQELDTIVKFDFPYHVLYDEKEKVENDNPYSYMFSDTPIESYDCSQRRFFGGDDITEVPAAVKNSKCSGMDSQAEKPVAACQHKFVLKPGEEKTINIILGPASDIDAIREIKSNLLQDGAIEKEFQKVQDYWEQTSEMISIDTPDRDLNHFVNYWLKKQIIFQTRTRRRSYYCPMRNELQDAMGYSMINNKEAVKYMFEVMARQETNGYIQQWNMHNNEKPRGMCLLRYNDGPVWLVICFCILINQYGDKELLDKKLSFKDSQGNATVYEHLLRAIDYLSKDLGEHGLCLMRDGDWTDPINGPGRKGKGESVWTTMSLKFAVMQVLSFCKKKNDQSSLAKLEGIRDSLDRALNKHAWDGSWYLTAYDDEGNAIGTDEDEEAKVFLNTQSWAIISRTARGERLKKCLESIESLETPFGPVLLDPPLSKWDRRWGKISVKLPGTSENGSVYCHASMFKAFADCLIGAGDKAYQTIKKTMPTNPDNPPESNWQVPIFIPNYYYGLKGKPSFGHSSQHNSTGTVSWMLWVTIEYILGVRATVDGLIIDPCLPEYWDEVTIKRKYKEAIYNVKITRLREKNDIREIKVDGNSIQGNLLPYNDGQTYQVNVEL